MVTPITVLALPFTIARARREARSPRGEARHPGQGIGTNAKPMCGFSSRPWRTMYMSDGTTPTPARPRGDERSSRARAILTNFRRPARLDIGMECRSQMAASRAARRGAPGREGGQQRQRAMHRRRTARGSYSAYLVGQYTKMAAWRSSVTRTSTCGEHTSVDAWWLHGGRRAHRRHGGDEAAMDLASWGAACGRAGGRGARRRAHPGARARRACTGAGTPSSPGRRRSPQLRERLTDRGVDTTAAMSDPDQGPSSTPRRHPGRRQQPRPRFRAVGGEPIFIARERARVHGEDGREYIDYIGSWGRRSSGTRTGRCPRGAGGGGGRPRSARPPA